MIELKLFICPQSDDAHIGTRDLTAQRVTLEELECRYILDIATCEDDNKIRAAELFGIDLSTLYRKLNRDGR